MYTYGAFGTGFSRGGREKKERGGWTEIAFISVQQHLREGVVSPDTCTAKDVFAPAWQIRPTSYRVRVTKSPLRDLYVKYNTSYIQFIS